MSEMQSCSHLFLSGFPSAGCYKVAMTTDGELLRRYAEAKSEDAFAELVRRHLGLVCSAALRQVNGDAHLAQDVAQAVFTDLACKAAALLHRQDLAGWLYTSAHWAAAKAVRTERRRLAHEREAESMHQLLQNAGPELDWERLSPMLDKAMHQLKERDRDVILMRYFENRPLAEIGRLLSLTEDAARKRVDRALERLRALLARQGVTATTALASTLSAHAAQYAPASLAATLTSAALAGASATNTVPAVAFTTTQAIAMTTIQKALIAATIVALSGTAVYTGHQATRLRADAELLRQRQAPLRERVAELKREREAATNRLAQAGRAQFNAPGQAGELLRLRGEVGRLR